MTSILLSLRKAKQILTLISTSPDLDAEILLAHVLAKPRSYLFAYPEYELTPEQTEMYSDLISLRRRGMPIAYIIEKKEFWSLELYVNQNVLIPRPETELLVETALTLLPKDEPLIIADLGTGSGAIALALAKERPKWQLYATDLSEKALEIAKKNAENLKISNIKFLLGNWYDPLPQIKFRAIVSNPPYIAINDPELEKHVAKYEPQSALTTPTGLEAIETLIQQAATYLEIDGILMLEHGYKQAAAVKNLFLKEEYTKIQCIQDFAGLDRITLGCIPMILQNANF